MGCLYSKVKRVKLDPESESEPESTIELPLYDPEPTIVIIKKKHRPINPVEQYKISAGLLPRITI